MLSIQNLREQRAAKAKALKELVEKEEWKVDIDQPVYDAGMAEIDEIDAKIKRITDMNEKIVREVVHDQVTDGLDRVAKDKKSPMAALYAKWLRNGNDGLSAEEWLSIRNTMSTTTPAEGGFTVQTDVAKTVLDALKAFGGMRSVAEILQMAQGNPLSFPTSDGTTEVGEIIAENQPATSQDVVFATKALPVYKYSSKIVTVPWELLQDSSVDIEAFVNQRIQTRLGRITNTHFTNGTGTGQPTGIITAATTGVTAANGTSQVTAVTYDSIINLIHSIDPAYRERNCRFMMHDTTVRELRKVKDGQQRPIFVPGYEVSVPGGAPDTLCGYPITVNQDVPVMAANAKSIAFGDFSYYKIRDVMAVTMFRFTDSVYTSKGQVGFLAWMRSGGNFIDVGGAVKLFVNAAT